MRLSLRVTVLLVLLDPTGADALEFLSDRLQLHGFASQAVVRTSANRYFGASTETSFEFTELGLNASFEFDPRVLLSGQLLVRRAGDMYDGTPSLDYALADVTLTSNASRRLGLRVGRIKNPLGLYNETRDVPFTRPGIFLPQVVYYDRVRNLVLSSDGLMLYGESYGAAGNLALTLGGGQAVVDENVEWTYLNGDFDGKLRPDGITWLARLWYSSQAEHIKLGISGASSTMRFDPGGVSTLDAGTIEFLYWVASFQYNAKDWTLSAEYSRVPVEWSNFGPTHPFPRQGTEGYYLQGAYRLRPDLELMLRYEEGVAERADRGGRRLSAMTDGALPPFDFFSKIWTTGLRWDISANCMLRLEYQRHHGTFALSARENPIPADQEEDWDVFAASISVRF